MSKEYKTKKDTFNLYDILGLTADVCNKENCNELIKRAYIRKAKKCHPDKFTGENKREAAEIYELLTGAYDILKNEHQRSEYNSKIKTKGQSSGDYGKLKKGAVDYSKTIGEYVPPSDEIKLGFKNRMSEMDSIRKYDRANENKLSIEDVNNKMSTIGKVRDDQDKTLAPENLFEGGTFSLSKFNAVFDKHHMKENTSMVPHGGAPMAWDNFGSSAGFSKFDDLDNLYVADGTRYDTARQSFGGVDFGERAQKITKNDILDIEDADYVTNHSKIEEDYYTNLAAKLKNRQGDATEFDSRTYKDYDRHDTAGYGIFDKLGYSFEDVLALDDDENISSKYEKMMASRAKDVAQPMQLQLDQSNQADHLPAPKSTSVRHKKKSIK